MVRKSETARGPIDSTTENNVLIQTMNYLKQLKVDDNVERSETGRRDNIDSGAHKY